MRETRQSYKTDSNSGDNCLISSYQIHQSVLPINLPEMLFLLTGSSFILLEKQFVIQKYIYLDLTL